MTTESLMELAARVEGVAVRRFPGELDDVPSFASDRAETAQQAIQRGILQQPLSHVQGGNTP